MRQSFVFARLLHISHAVHDEAQQQKRRTSSSSVEFSLCSAPLFCAVVEQKKLLEEAPKKGYYQDVNEERLPPAGFYWASENSQGVDFVKRPPQEEAIREKWEHAGYIGMGNPPESKQPPYGFYHTPLQRDKNNI